MGHNRKYVPGIVDLVKIRFKNTHLVLATQDQIESMIIDSNYLNEAPFKWVGLIYRIGLKNKLKPEYQRINKKYGDLPIAIELDSHILKWADTNNLQLFKDIFIIGALDALIDVGHKYNLPLQFIEEEKRKYGDIPNTIKECEDWVKNFQK